MKQNYILKHGSSELKVKLSIHPDSIVFAKPRYSRVNDYLFASLKKCI